MSITRTHLIEASARDSAPTIKHSPDVSDDWMKRAELQESKSVGTMKSASVVHLDEWVRRNPLISTSGACVTRAVLHPPFGRRSRAPMRRRTIAHPLQ